MKIPDSLHRCEDAVIMAQELIDALSDDDYTLDNFSWSKAGVRSIQRFDDIVFTEEERIFFNRLLLDLYIHAKNNWQSIPGYSSYEINCDGVVRIAMNAPIVEERGELVPLNVFVPDKSKPDQVTETYKLISDEPLLKLISKDDLLKLITA